MLTTSATYETKRGAWWESMGIMVAYMAEGGPGKNPFKRRVDYRGTVTHGHLAENNNHGGRPTSLPDPRQLPDGPENPGNLDIIDFKYQFGDLSLPGQAGLPPVIRPWPVAQLPQPDRRPEAHLSLDHLVQGPLQPFDGHRVPDRRRSGPVRVEHARVRRSACDRGAGVEDADQSESGHLRVLLPHPPIHARVLPGQAVVPLYAPVNEWKAVRRSRSRRAGARRPRGGGAERGRPAR